MTMGQIVVHTFATLDGVIEASPAEAYQPYMDDEIMQETLSLVTEMDAQLLGRDTYQHLAKAWRSQTGPIADRLNSMPKYVLSRTLESADDWDNTTIVGYDEVAGLRTRLNLVSYGCGRLARDLLRDGLLDELQLWLAPVVAGSGARLFDEPEELLRLQLAETRAFATGALRVTYAGVSA
jgi:dihydrofolate reductase